MFETCCTTMGGRVTAEAGACGGGWLRKCTGADAVSDECAEEGVLRRASEGAAAVLLCAAGGKSREGAGGGNEMGSTMSPEDKDKEQRGNRRAVEVTPKEEAAREILR